MKFSSSAVSITTLKEEMLSFSPTPSLPHDAVAAIAVREAIEAAKEGNIGVGGCMVKDGSSGLPVDCVSGS